MSNIFKVRSFLHGETGTTFYGAGNLLRVLAANGLQHAQSHPGVHIPATPAPGVLMAANAPGRVLLAHPVSPAVDVTSDLLSDTSLYFLPSRLFETLPGGRYGSTDEDCFFSQGMMTTQLGDALDYELDYEGDRDTGSVYNPRWLTKALLDERVADLADFANMGSGFANGSAVYYNVRTNYNAPLARQTGFMTRPPFEANYGGQFSIGSLEMELEFYYSSTARLRYKRVISGGRIIAFPQGAPGTVVQLLLTARPTLHPVNNGYNQGGPFHSIAVPAGRLSVGVRFLPIAGTFTNAYPSPLAADRSFLTDWDGGVMDAGGLADVRSVSVDFPSVSGRDGAYIRLDDISLPFANLKVPESRLGLLFVSYAFIVEDFQNAVKKDVLTSLKIYDGFDDLAWSESGGHVTFKTLQLSQSSTWKVEILGQFRNSLPSHD